LQPEKKFDLGFEELSEFVDPMLSALQLMTGEQTIQERTGRRMVPPARRAQPVDRGEERAQP
jgi:hypothetical protein